MFQRLAQGAKSARVATTVVAPEPSRKATVVQTQGVEKKETPRGNAAELVDEPLKLVVIEMVRHCDAQTHVECSIGERKLGSVGADGARASSAPAKIRQRTQIDVDENAIQAKTGREAAAGAAHVQEPAAR